MKKNNLGKDVFCIYKNNNKWITTKDDNKIPFLIFFSGRILDFCFGIVFVIFCILGFICLVDKNYHWYVCIMFLVCVLAGIFIVVKGALEM